MKNEKISKSIPTPPELQPAKFTMFIMSKFGSATI